ncbi:MAG: DUF1566 domain-containing protein [Labilibaculum antarcticum]
MRLNWILISSLAFLAGTFACSDDDTIIDSEIVEENLPDVTGYPIVGTNQTTFFNNSSSISAPSSGDDFYGQNANYLGTTPQYVDNGDGTVTDMVTGLMWQQTLDHNSDGLINYDDKLTYAEILALASEVTTGDYTDWRVPTIKEQYSLMMFSGRDISGYEGTSTEGLTPFINTDYFAYNYGDTDAGERLIDVQCASTNVSVGNTEVEIVFGVNFADGRIKGYGTTMMGQAKVFNYLMVRGNTTYGENNFSDNGDGTISDLATDLMWMQDDSNEGLNWQNALAYAESFEFAGRSDWHLPSAKELQSIVDYSRSPQSSASAAINSIFNCTQITNEAGEVDYPFYWSGTTHATTGDENNGGWGAYVAFGRAMGNESSMPSGPPSEIDESTKATSSINWTDVHGAGAQRSYPKSGDLSEYSEGHGPQGDAVRILNYIRLVRDIK